MIDNDIMNLLLIITAYYKGFATGYSCTPFLILNYLYDHVND